MRGVGFGILVEWEKFQKFKHQVPKIHKENLLTCVIWRLGFGAFKHSP